LEKHNLDNSYAHLASHISKIFSARIGHGMLEDFVVKYLWGASGYLLCAVPVFFDIRSTTQQINDVGSRTQAFVTNRRLLVSASDAVGRVM
jgi:ATP-binding cassette, subfamily D (ALD), peroxisomal long-chain fatty acid import protein